jgi:N-methylhydantoinase B
MTTMNTVDSFTGEILRSYLISTVREMVATTVRTAYSTCFSEGEDFTCGLFDVNGRMVAQAHGVTAHAGSLGDAVSYVIQRAGRVSEGDVLLHNDPYTWATHQADGLLVRPMFARGHLLGFVANRGHWTDIGGMTPGGWSGAAEDVVQEGLRIPGVRLVKAGVIDADLRDLLLMNVRLPNQFWGDVQAQIASGVIAERRIQELVDRYGLEGYDAAIEAALTYSRRRFEVGLAQIEDGTAEASDFIEDDGRGNGPFEIRLKLTKSGNRILADFTGTAPQRFAPVNCSLACTKAAVVGPVATVVDPEIPLNAGFLDLIEVTAPLGSLINPTHPAPMFAGTADPLDRVAETVLKALAQLAASRACAGSYSTGNNVTGSGRTKEGRQFLWYSYQSGGCGARFGADGNSAEWHLMANSKNESMEVWETRYPIEFLGYRLIDDSGGAGRWRGGLGTERRIKVLVETKLSGTSDHHFKGAAGIAGGRDGLPNGFAVERGGQRRSLQEWYGLQSPSKFANLKLQPGDVFVSIQGGGGGYGDPTDRPPEDLQADMREGYLSEEAATRDYGGIDPLSDGPRDNVLAPHKGTLA